MNLQMHDLTQVSLVGKAFHRLSKFNHQNQTLYQIHFMNYHAKLTPEQTILLSLSAYKYNRKNGLPFEISKHQNGFFNQQIRESLRSLVKLFKNTEQVEINSQNKSAFLYLADQLDNKSLQKICSKVYPNSPQKFFLSSKRFSNIPIRILSQLSDFTVYINNEPFRCNSSFACCLSDSIFELKLQDSTIQEFRFENVEEYSILTSFFQVLNGYSFSLSRFNLNIIQVAIDLIGFTLNYSEMPFPTNFHETNMFLSKPIFANYEQQFEVSTQMIANEFSLITAEIFSHFTTKSIEKFFISKLSCFAIRNFFV
jgi:hypothetical protein